MPGTARAPGPATPSAASRRAIAQALHPTLIPSLSPIGGAQQQHDSEDIRLLARRAEHAVQRLVPQMVEQGKDDPGVAEEHLRGVERGAGLHGATVGDTTASRIVRSA